MLLLCQTKEFQLINQKVSEGRYTKPHPKPADERHCIVCRTGDIEDEIHFLCHCEGYNELRSNFDTYN